MSLGVGGLALPELVSEVERREMRQEEVGLWAE